MLPQSASHPLSDLRRLRLLTWLAAAFGRCTSKHLVSRELEKRCSTVDRYHCGCHVYCTAVFSGGRRSKARGGVRHLWGVQPLERCLRAPDSHLGSPGPASASLLGRASGACWGCRCCRCLCAFSRRACACSLFKFSVRTGCAQHHHMHCVWHPSWHGRLKSLVVCYPCLVRPRER